MSCLKNIGFSIEEIDSIWSLIAAILNLGNVTYRVDPDHDEAHIEDKAKPFV